ncbi:MAG: MFS transporter [Rhodospirillales bacterium]|nr:MFS transporter [Rhodospirillales bacterium]
MDHVTRTAVLSRAATPPGGLLLGTLCLGVLIAQVDTSVVNLAAQPLAVAFHAGVTPLQWVIDAYNLVYAALLLTCGLIADLYGRRRAFMAGAVLMTLASLACALAPGIGVLIAGRAVAGLGAALLLPASLAILRVAWPDPVARGQALGVWASCNGLAFVIGPGLGGLLIASWGWRSVFFLIVPLGAAAFLLARTVVAESADRGERRFDLPGQALGALALGGLAAAAIADTGTPVRFTAALGLAALAAPLFLHIERRAGPTALVPLALFRSASFSGALAATGAMTFGIYGMIFLLPMVWQASGRFGPEAAGLALTPCAALFFLVSQGSGALTQHLGRRAMIAGGTALIGCGLTVVALTRAGTPLPLAEAGLGLAGIGMGLNTGPLYAVAVGAVAAERSGTAASLINVARMSGATLGVAILGTAFGAAHGGAAGLEAAMLAGGAVQLAGAAIAWAMIR